MSPDPRPTDKGKYFQAEKVDDTMVMIGGEGEDARGVYVDRNVFYDLGADGWKWRKDRSWDGGATWFEGIAHITARRAGTAPPAAAGARGER